MKFIRYFAPRVLAVLLALMLPVSVGLFSTEGDIAAIESRVPFHKVAGHVARLDCDDHARFYVAYELNGHSYTGMALNSSAWYCDELRVNDRLELWYSERDPYFISMISPQEALDDLRGDFWTPVVFGTIAALMMTGAMAVGFDSRKLS